MKNGLVDDWACGLVKIGSLVGRSNFAFNQ